MPERANIVIPAAGEGSRFAKAGYAKPKPFIDVLGRPMIDIVMENVAMPGSRQIVLLRAEHAAAEAKAVDRMRGAGAVIVPVDRLTEGTACTVLLARAYFDDDRPLLIANSDQWVDFACAGYMQDFIDRGLDGSILVFREPTRNVKWSYARVDDDGMVVEVAEKKPISDLATVGLYAFRRGRDFIDAATAMIEQNDRVNNEFYTCPVYNHLIRKGGRVGVFEVPASAMHGLGTVPDLERYIAFREGLHERLA